MLTEQTVTKLRSMRLHGMAETYAAQRQDPSMGEMSFDERFGMLVEREWLHQHNQALERRLRYARLKHQACVEDIDWHHPRGLKRAIIEPLCTSEWIRYGQHCLITGPTGAGKSWLACALGQKACRDGYRARYCYCPRLFRDLLAAQMDGTLSKLLRRLGRVDMLIVDDWGMAVAKRSEFRDFLELLDDRQGARSVLITSQYPVSSWHGLVGEPTVADAIMDRLVHNAHIIELEGESMRDPKGSSTGRNA